MQEFLGAIVPPSTYASYDALVSSIRETSNCTLTKKYDTLREDDVEIDSKVATNGSIKEYKTRNHGFSQIKGVSHDDTLAKDHGLSRTEEVHHDITLTLGFSLREGIGLVHLGPIAKRFEMYERDSRVHKMMTLHGLLPIPQASYSRIEQ